LEILTKESTDNEETIAEEDKDLQFRRGSSALEQIKADKIIRVHTAPPSI
jgi:hypothetical protein